MVGLFLHSGYECSSVGINIVSVNDMQEGKLMAAARNQSINLLKLISAYAVVICHGIYSPQEEILFKSVVMFSVPVFFMISGYFAYGNDRPTLQRKAFKQLKLFLCLEPICYITSVIWAGGFYDPTSGSPIQAITAMILLNKPFVGTHLWFLLALAYDYITYMCLARLLESKQKLYWLIPIILLPNFVSTALPVHWTRNFFIEGLPLFLIGTLIRKHEFRLKNIPSLPLFAVMLLCLPLPIIEGFFIREQMNFYLGSLVVCVCSVILAIKHPLTKNNHLLFFAGSATTAIYLYHPLIKKILWPCIEMMGGSIKGRTARMLFLVLQCICTTLFAIAWVNIKRIYTQHKNV